MKVLLDECLPRRLMYRISGHEVTTVVLVGWSGKKNGELLRLAASRFEVFVTADRNLSFQQAVSILPLAVPEGQGVATVTVLDAAGNRAVETFDLTIDGTPPEAAFTAPAPGSALSGRFDVEVDASDDLGEADVTLYADGALVALAPGPHAVVTLDTADFPSGALELKAIALARAGNESEPATLLVNVP